MNVENPLAYSFILQDDIYLLPADKQAFQKREPPAAEVGVAEETPEPEFKCLGGHKKQYLIITHYPDCDFMADAHLAALESTLKRLGYGLNDAAIFNLANYPAAQFEQIIGFFKPQKMLILGKKALPPDKHVPHPNRPLAMGGVPTLFTFSFSEMMDSVESKKEFWEAMKLF